MHERPNGSSRTLFARIRGYILGTRLDRSAIKFFAIGVPGLLIALVSLIAIERLAPHSVTLSALWREARPTSGLILVDEPQVYTRERLVNDRLREATWLQDLLFGTPALAAQQQFGGAHVSISDDQVFEARISRKALGQSEQPAGGTEKADHVAGGSSPADTTPNRPSSAPVDRFIDEERYRTLIRSALMATQLDDQHDIQGNTLYRLSFGVSMLPSSNSRSVAVVAGQIGETFYSRDYEELLQDWKISLGNLLEQKYRDRFNEINIGGSFGPQRTQFRDFLVKSICEHFYRVVRLEDTNIEIRDCKNIEKRPSDKYIDAILVRLSIFNGMESPMTEIMKWLQAEGNKLRFSNCSAFVGQIGQSDNKYCNAKSYSEASLAAIIYDMCTGTKGFKPNACPSAVSADIEIDSMVRFLSVLMALEDMEGKFGQSTSIRSYDAIERAVICGVPDFQSTAVLAELDHVDHDKAERVKIQSREYYCRSSSISADVQSVHFDSMVINSRIAWNYTVFEFNETKSKNGAGDYLRDYFDVEAPPSCSRSCQPSISIREGVNVKDLHDALSENLFVYTYAMEPGTEVQRISGALRTYESVGLGGLSKGGSVADVEAGMQRISELAALERDTLTLGFGDWATIGRETSGSQSNELARAEQPPRDRSARASASFGWFVLPRRTIGGDGGTQQPADRRTLSVLVSMPSWWRRAEVSFRSCWLDVDVLASRKIDEALCRMEDAGFDDRAILVRLPGRAIELQQKLTFEVVSYPFISPDTPRIALQAGRPAYIPIAGGRLWRSPFVMLGSQKADTIEVLPNMQGIVAGFRCVEPQASETRPRGELNAEQFLLTVWTSEGSITNRSPYTIKPFVSNGPSDTPCYGLNNVASDANPTSTGGAGAGGEVASR